MKIVLVTGGFDPIHSGHIQYFKYAKKLGDKLIVGLNSDAWLKRKKDKYFMNWSERATIARNLRMVDDVIDFDDSDGTAINAIRKVLDAYPDAEVVFANGGDRTVENIPEMSIQDNRLSFEFSVGGDNKLNSSSDILRDWDKGKVYVERQDRHWGEWSVLKNYKHTKVKELLVKPHRQLSMQRHIHRSEYWFVAEGTATLRREDKLETLEKHQGTTIKVKDWHQLINNTDQPLKIVEIQYGKYCDEEDIERK